MYRGDIKYVMAHRRVSKYFGNASQHLCIVCGENAKEWSYIGNSPFERSQEHGGYTVTYSPRSTDYEPLCIKCHRHKDIDYENSKYGETNYTVKIPDKDIEKIRNDARTHKEIADQYGVNQSTITRIKNGKRRRRS